MTGELRGTAPGPEPCRICGGEAVGPCARCRAPVCGDCCVLSEGGATTFAVCTRCDRRGGASLGRAWVELLAWIAVPVLVLAAVALGLAWLSR